MEYLYNTEQEVFDKVATHLLTQKKKSVKTTFVADGVCQSIPQDVCRYRDGKGNSCAIGCLIPDGVYSEIIEGLGVLNVNLKPLLANVMPPSMFNYDGFFLVSLQRIHDGSEVQEWKNKLLDLASEKGLNSSVLNNFT